MAAQLPIAVKAVRAVDGVPMNEGAETKPARIFVGLKISPQIAGVLATQTSELKEARVRLIAPADIHLTLVPPWQEGSIDQAVERLRRVAGMFKPFALTFQHLGYGPQPRRPNLLWADCAATDDITTLRDALMQAFGQQDSRPFRPHVTLVRIREGQRSVARRHPIDRALNLEQMVQTVELFRSPPPGATGYQILASLELGNRDATVVDIPASGPVTAD